MIEPKVLLRDGRVLRVKEARENVNTGRITFIDMLGRRIPAALILSVEQPA